jgi:hypothetical protein
MRAAVAAVFLAHLVSLSLGVPAAAQPTPTPTGQAETDIEVPSPAPGEEVCTITDWRLQELSGLVALDDGTFVVINDGGQAWEAQPIFFLDQQCQVVDQIPFHETRDPEDLAYDRASGVLWVGDTGDNTAAGTGGGLPRETVALWRVDLNGDRTPVIHRFAYPDGPHDAEALILDGDGTPIIVIKTVGAAGLYRPAAPMVPNNPPEQAVPLERIGEFTPPDTGAEHSFGRIARLVITGGANAPDGSRVVLRTYTDAFEFDVTDGDVVGAITSGTPRITPLRGEPQGEAITYSPDGQYFLTVSETAQETGVDPVILRYTPTPPPPEPTPEDEEDVAAPPPGGRSLLDRLGPQGIINLIGAVGVIGLLMVGIGVYGIVRARRSPEEETDPDDDLEDEEYDGYEPYEDGAQPATAHARVAPPSDSGYPGWEQEAGHQPGVYTARSATYGGEEYGEQPDPGATPPVPDYGTAPPRGGTVYSAGAGYQEHPFDQGYPDGYHEYHQGGHQGDYQGDYQEQGYAQPPGQPEAGGVYSGGAYQYSQDDVPDYYSDDPDYPYEFRDRGSW